MADRESQGLISNELLTRETLAACLAAFPVRERYPTIQNPPPPVWFHSYAFTGRQRCPRPVPTMGRAAGLSLKGPGRAPPYSGPYGGQGWLPGGGCHTANPCTVDVLAPYRQHHSPLYRAA